MAFMLVREYPLSLFASIPAATEVHLWSFDCNAPHDDSVLCIEEKARAARYTIDAPRQEFIAGRATLRTVLGKYLACKPVAIAFTVSAGGKPAIRDHSDLHFNVTHSGGRGLIAIATSPVGVDIEQLRPVPNAAGLVQRFFTPEEQRQFALLPEDQKLAGFFKGWTGKEALLKAVGVGLAGVEQVAVDLDPAQPARVIRFDGNSMNWQLKTWMFREGYLASVAIPMGAMPTALRGHT
ncbi:4'-phosphopantetheinyl transferase superfamily protein [soil metagenome]